MFEINTDFIFSFAVFKTTNKINKLQKLPLILVTVI